jgi:hypothetical protein
VNDLTAQEAVRVTVVYTSALAPLLLVGVGHWTGRLPRWIAAVYLASLVVCAVGWEIWFTFGIWDGAPVDARRPEALNQAIPQALNWLLNSLADAGSIGLLGLLGVWLAYGRRPTAFERWRWGAFAILLTWFVVQNLFVELFIYHEQLALGHQLSWAPLAPTGPWWNPTLFSVAGRSVRFQTQIPWLLMTPLFYLIVLACYRNLGEHRSPEIAPRRGPRRDI